MDALSPTHSAPLRSRCSSADPLNAENDTKLAVAFSFHAMSDRKARRRVRNRPHGACHDAIVGWKLVSVRKGSLDCSCPLWTLTTVSHELTVLWGRRTS